MPKHILGIRGTLAAGILFTSSRKLKCFSAINHSSGFDSKTTAIQRPSHAEFEGHAGAWRAPSCRCNQNEAGYMPPRKACPASEIISKCSLGCCCQQQKRMRSSAFYLCGKWEPPGLLHIWLYSSFDPGAGSPRVLAAWKCIELWFMLICIHMLHFHNKVSKNWKGKRFLFNSQMFLLFFFFTCDSRDWSLGLCTS